jgi:hypothetical protein
MIEVKSKLDASITSPLIRLQLRKFWWAFIVLPLFFIFTGVLYVAYPESESFDIGLGIFLIAFGVLFLPLVYLSGKALQKKLNKSMKLMSVETTNYFRFDGDKIYQETNLGEDHKSTAEFNYNLLHKAYETKSHFFMYISMQQAHVLPKKDITAGTPEELAEIFRNRLGKKFKVLKLK